ncbi:MAG: ATPase [Oscillospiraceae bacterium]
MNIEEILDMLDDLLDRAWSLPLSNGRCVVDADKVRDLIDEVRLNLPTQMKNAKAIVANQEEILVQAKKESEAIVRKAEDRARVLITNEEVVKQAQALANDIVSNAQMKAKEMRHASQDFSDLMLKQTEEVLVKSLTDVKATRQAIKNAQRQLAQQPARDEKN